MVRQIMKKAALSLAKRESLKAGQFAIPRVRAKRLGVLGEVKGSAKGKYPIDTLKRARNALARVSQFGSPGERVSVRKKVYSKYPELKSSFEERHGENPVAKKNVRKVEQGGIGKSAASAMFLAFVDEMTKIAVAPPSIRNALTRGSTFSANALKPNTIKERVVGFGTAATKPMASSGMSGTAGARQTVGVVGANLRTPTTVDPKLPLVRGTPPASPIHAAPQVNPQAAQIRQGAPQTVNSSVPAASGASGMSAGGGGASQGRMSR